jgi:hypothetical protein
MTARAEPEELVVGGLYLKANYRPFVILATEVLPGDMFRVSVLLGTGMRDMLIFQKYSLFHYSMQRIA